MDIVIIVNNMIKQNNSVFNIYKYVEKDIKKNLNSYIIFIWNQGIYQAEV